MTHLYQRPGNRMSELPIHWNPEDETLGKQAVESVVGQVQNYPADVTAEEAAQIREEYQQLKGDSQ